MIKAEIGINAGRIWQFLDKKEESSISEIRRALSMKSSDVWIALGWLARENKVFFFEEENNQIKVILLY